MPDPYFKPWESVKRRVQIERYYYIEPNMQRLNDLHITSSCMSCAGGEREPPLCHGQCFTMNLRTGWKMLKTLGQVGRVKSGPSSSTPLQQKYVSLTFSLCLWYEISRGTTTLRDFMPKKLVLVSIATGHCYKRQTNLGHVRTNLVQGNLPWCLILTNCIHITALCLTEYNLEYILFIIKIVTVTCFV